MGFTVHVYLLSAPFIHFAPAYLDISILTHLHKSRFTAEKCTQTTQTAPSNPLTKGKVITSPSTITFTSWKTSALSKKLSKDIPLKIAPTSSGRVIVD
jgi:hypothetical protein